MSDTIDPEEIINSAEIPTIESLKCPIDLLIPVNPTICSKCQNIFCKKCIDEWKKKKSKCPLCHEEFIPFKLDTNFIKLQLKKVKLQCPNHLYGCNEGYYLSEKEKHLKECNYSPIECMKCKKIIPKKLKYEHLIKECDSNKVKCIFCEEFCALWETTQHFVRCVNERVGICKKCETIHKNEGECIMDLSKCEKCGILDMKKDITENKHNCIDIKASNAIEEHLTKLNEKFKNEYFTIYKNQNSALDILKKEIKAKANEIFTVLLNSTQETQREIDKVNELLNQKLNESKTALLISMMTIKKEINEIKEETVLLDYKIKNFENFMNYLARNFNGLLTQQNTYETSEVNFLKGILDTLLNRNSKDTEIKVQNVQNVSKKIIEGIAFKEKVKGQEKKEFQPVQGYCKRCEELSNETYKCIDCQLFYCRKCIYQVPNEGMICKCCVINCSLCNKKTQKKFLNKCFSDNCKNMFCTICYENNKHQIKDKTRNCDTIVCDNCNKKNICVMQSALGKDEKRICKVCYLAELKNAN